ncbi:NUDIX hydrolase [Granulicatella adiacens]
MDFRVIGDAYRYGVRVSAVVVKDGKLLTYKVEDQNHLVGGAILVGEASRKAVAREVKEELGVDCEVEELMFVVENRFDYKGELHHMIEFHYKVNLLGEVPSHTLDEEKYECEWIDLQRLSEYDIRPQYLTRELPHWKAGIKQIDIGVE